MRTLFVTLALTAAVLAQGGPPPLPPPPVPPQNPITPAKTVLGKILFWEEQLSSDDTTACGTCHTPTAGGGEVRQARNPGRDGQVNTPDDVLGSPGVVRSDVRGDYKPDAVFGFNRQITGRNAPNFSFALYSPLLFWDGRASSTFVDPQTQQVLIPGGGALESQVVGPPVSDAEMAHEQRSWGEITAKLGSVVPLRLATNLPADVRAALAANPSYPSLFRAAFGDPTITAARIAFAVATYERTLVPNQTPRDRGQLTPAQQRGQGVFGGQGGCAVCHGGPLLTDQQFHNTGVRPIVEDNGRQAITGQPQDAGRFKTPGLRNVGLKSHFQHNGVRTTLEEVVDFYIRGGDFPQNRDVRMQPLLLSPGQRSDLIEFLRNGLTDPRMAAGLPPFDRPTLLSERVPFGSNLYGQGTVGTGGVPPRMLAGVPAHLGHSAFKIGVGSAPGNAAALLALAGLPAQLNIGGLQLLVDPATLFVLPAVLTPGGYASMQMPIPDDASLAGAFVAQWLVADPAATIGLSASVGARFTLF